MRRSDDRDFLVGDILVLQEYEPENNQYSGREFRLVITYITSAENPCALSGSGLTKGYCILSVKPAPSE